MQTTIELTAHDLEEGFELEITSHDAADGSAKRKDARIGTNSAARVAFEDGEVLVVRKVKAQGA
jgi:hypothetical protein